MYEDGAKKQKKIMGFGAFDVLHQGHLNFFKQARALVKNPFLIISVARDINVLKIKRKKPLNDEKKRLMNVKRLKIVNKTVLGNTKNYMLHILEERPDIIVLGYDQSAYTENLRKKLKKGGLNTKIVRLKPYFPKIYKSSILRKKMLK